MLHTYYVYVCVLIYSLLDSSTPHMMNTLRKTPRTKTPALVYSAVVLSPNYDPLISHKFPWFEHCTTLKFDGDN